MGREAQGWWRGRLPPRAHPYQSWAGWAPNKQRGPAQQSTPAERKPSDKIVVNSVLYRISYVPLVERRVSGPETRRAYSYDDPIWSYESVSQNAAERIRTIAVRPRRVSNSEVQQQSTQRAAAHQKRDASPHYSCSQPNAQTGESVQVCWTSQYERVLDRRNAGLGAVETR